MWQISRTFSSVQSLSHVRLFATPWIAARQASLSITNSRSSPKLISRTFKSCKTEALSFPQLLATILFSLSKSLTTLRYLDKWNNVVFVFLGQIYFTWSSAFRVPACCSMWQDFLLFFLGWKIFYCMYMPRFLYPPIHQQILRLLLSLGCCEHGYANIWYIFSAFGYIFRSVTIGS